MNDAGTQKDTIAAILSDSELVNLLNLAAVKIEEGSPLSQLSAGDIQADIPGDIARLKQLGFLESAKPPRLSPQCYKALQILADPDTEIRLVWGDPDKVNFSAVFSTMGSGSNELVVFTRDKNGGNHISYFLSHENLIDLITERIVFSDIKEAADMSIDADVTALPVFFAILDLYREAQLKATLDRRQEFVTNLSLDEIMRILLDAKTDASLDWYAPVGYMVMPMDVGLDKSAVLDGLSVLKKEGIVASDANTSALSSTLTTFAHSAFPIVSYLGIRAGIKRGEIFEVSQIGLIRSIATLLAVQLAPAKNNGAKILINSISTSDMPELLFNLVTRPFEAPSPGEIRLSKPPTPPPPEGEMCYKCGTLSPTGAKFCTKCSSGLETAPEAAPKSTEGSLCGKCGNANPVGAKFCTKCGSTFEPDSDLKFCPACGDPVAENEKFCNKCGRKLT